MFPRHGTVCETTCFYYSNWDNYFVYEHDFKSLGFEITATGHFHFQDNETEDMLMYQRNPVRVKLFPTYTLEKSTWINKEMTLCAPEEFFWGAKMESTIHTFTGLEFSCITGLELPSIKRAKSRNGVTGDGVTAYRETA